MTPHQIRKYYKNNKDWIDKIHHRKNLKFLKIEIQELKGATKTHLYKSPTRNRRQSSEYKLAEINGRLAYTRKSNHWGTFCVNDGYDEYGDVIFKQLNWNLTGGDNDRKTSQAGYIYIDEL
tara:strand:+ start:129 stop:491 length:363 start_codon:yes stop_codon:yes gene_type:complete